MTTDSMPWTQIAPDSRGSRRWKASGWPSSGGFAAVYSRNVDKAIPASVSYMESNEAWCDTESQDSLERKERLAYFADELRIDESLLKLSAKYHAQNFVIERVTVISMSEGRAVPNQSVVVKDGRTTSVSPSASVENAHRMRIINGMGAYLIPGLTDMHIHHFGSSSQHLLNFMRRS